MSIFASSRHLRSRLRWLFVLSYSLIDALLLSGFTSAASINLLPGDGALTGFGYPRTSYRAQTFVAPNEPLNAIVMPVAGPASFRVLVAETGEDQLRPTNVLFESNDVVLSGEGTQVSEPTFYYPDLDPYSDGTGIHLSTDLPPSSRAEHFALPLQSDVNQRQDVWRIFFDYAMWLGFGDQTLDTFAEPLISFPWHSPVAVKIDVGGLSLTPGETYAVVIDGAILAIPEPSTLLLLMGFATLISPTSPSCRHGKRMVD